MRSALASADGRLAAAQLLALRSLSPARLDHVDDSSNKVKIRPRAVPRFVRVFIPRHHFSTNDAAKMATPETFSETGSETMYEKV